MAPRLIDVAVQGVYDCGDEGDLVDLVHRAHIPSHDDCGRPIELHAVLGVARIIATHTGNCRDMADVTNVPAEFGCCYDPAKLTAAVMAMIYHGRPFKTVRDPTNAIVWKMYK